MILNLFRRAPAPADVPAFDPALAEAADALDDLEHALAASRRRVDDLRRRKRGAAALRRRQDEARALARRFASDAADAAARLRS